MSRRMGVMMPAHALRRKPSGKEAHFFFQSGFERARSS
jgi:hypothetical protein